jgi:hypothetical protein
MPGGAPAEAMKLLRLEAFVSPTVTPITGESLVSAAALAAGSVVEASMSTMTTSEVNAIDQSLVTG